ncbi:MAG: hypothetical protein M3O33_18340, partial [Cyanobacteriota bacterium]|nr:hypothetical protein [Cyanobacteriota bacterium]
VDDFDDLAIGSLPQFSSPFRLVGYFCRAGLVCGQEPMKVSTAGNVASSTIQKYIEAQGKD